MNRRQLTQFGLPEGLPLRTVIRLVAQADLVDIVGRFQPRVVKMAP